MNRETEPPRLLNDDLGDPLVRRLLRSARVDAPSARALVAAPAAVAALVATHTAAGALAGSGAAYVSSGSAWSLGVLGKWVGIGALAGATVSAATVSIVAPPPAKRAAAVARSASSNAPAARELSKRRPAEAPLPAPISSEELSEPRIELAPRVAPRADLSREIALLDGARAALAAGDAERALRVLAAADELPRRALLPEATVLRVRALLQLGRRDEARRVADELLRRAPSSPQASVLRDLVDSASVP